MFGFHFLPRSECVQGPRLRVKEKETEIDSKSLLQLIMSVICPHWEEWRRRKARRHHSFSTVMRLCVCVISSVTAPLLGCSVSGHQDSFSSSSSTPIAPRLPSLGCRCFIWHDRTVDRCLPTCRWICDVKPNWMCYPLHKITHGEETHMRSILLPLSQSCLLASPGLYTHHMLTAGREL